MWVRLIRHVPQAVSVGWRQALMGQITASLLSDMSIISSLWISHLSSKETEARAATTKQSNLRPLSVDLVWRLQMCHLDKSKISHAALTCKSGRHIFDLSCCTSALTLWASAGHIDKHCHYCTVRKYIFEHRKKVSGRREMCESQMQVDKEVWNRQE